MLQYVANAMQPATVHTAGYLHCKNGSAACNINV